MNTTNFRVSGVLENVEIRVDVIVISLIYKSSQYMLSKHFTTMYMSRYMLHIKY